MGPSLGSATTRRRFLLPASAELLLHSTQISNLLRLAIQLIFFSETSFGWIAPSYGFGVTSVRVNLFLKTERPQYTI